MIAVTGAAVAVSISLTSYTANEVDEAWTVRSLPPSSHSSNGSPTTIEPWSPPTPTSSRRNTTSYEDPVEVIVEEGEELSTLTEYMERIKAEGETDSDSTLTEYMERKKAASTGGETGSESEGSLQERQDDFPRSSQDTMPSLEVLEDRGEEGDRQERAPAI